MDVVGTGGAADEEGLAIIVEVPRGARPSEADVQALASHVRATVRAAARVHGLGLQGFSCAWKVPGVRCYTSHVQAMSRGAG